MFFRLCSYTVPKKEVSEFNKELSERIESSGLAEAIQKANKFLDGNDLPLHWEKSSLFNLSVGSDSDDNASEVSLALKRVVSPIKSSQ